jgi:hypothetical protein
MLTLPPNSNEYWHIVQVVCGCLCLPGRLCDTGHAKWTHRLFTGYWVVNTKEFTPRNVCVPVRVACVAHSTRTAQTTAQACVLRRIYGCPTAQPRIYECPVTNRGQCGVGWGGGGVRSGGEGGWSGLDILNASRKEVWRLATNKIIQISRPTLDTLGHTQITPQN